MGHTSLDPLPVVHRYQVRSTHQTKYNLTLPNLTYTYGGSSPTVRFARRRLPSASLGLLPKIVSYAGCSRNPHNWHTRQFDRWVQTGISLQKSS